MDELVGKVKFLAINADVVHVSTAPLKRKLTQYNENIKIIPNTVDADLWDLSTERGINFNALEICKKQPIRIGYIGTPTHDEDLDLVVDAVNIIKKEYGSKVEFEVIGAFQRGPVKFGSKIPLPQNTDYPSFVRWLRKRINWDIGIIPLSDSIFNRSKSHLKFLEYSALDLAIAVSDVENYKMVASPNDTAVVCLNATESWVYGLRSLIECADLRRRLVSHAKANLLESHVIGSNKALSQSLGSLLRQY